MPRTKDHEPRRISHPPITDLHWDGSMVEVIFGKSLLERTSNPQIPLTKGDFQNGNNTDLPRMRDGGVQIVFANSFPFPLDAARNDFVSPQNFLTEHSRHRAVYRELEKRQPDQVRTVKFAQDLEPTIEQGKIAMIGSVEGLQLSGKPATDEIILESLIQDGTRNFGIMWNEPNVLGTPCYADEDRGLSPYGKSVVKHLADRGMIIDLSHASPETARGILDAVPTEAKVIATHAGAKKLSPSPRNLPDDVLDGIKEHKGIVGIPFVRSFVKRPENNEASAIDVVSHIRYVSDRIGPDRVAFGTDFGGSHIKGRVAGLDNVATAGGVLYGELRKTSEFTPEQIAGFFGGNGKRYLQQNLPRR